MSTTLISLITTALLGLSASADDTKPTGDLARMQGTWTAKMGPEKNIPLVATVKNTKIEVVLTIQGEDVKMDGELKIDEKASPRTIDWINFKSKDGDDVPANLGIYKFDGDRWIVCNGGRDNPRPTEFKAGEGGSPILIELSKKSDAPKESPKGDLAKFQGKWKATLNDGDVKVALEIKGQDVSATWTRGGDTVELKGRFQIDEKVAPKTIDFVGFKRPNGEELPDNPGIYAIDGESIAICVGGGGNARPTEFKAGDGGQPTLFTLEKVKE